MLSTILNVVFGTAAVYFFYQQNYLVAVVLLVVTVVRVFQRRLQRFATTLAQIAKYSDLEKRSNCSLELKIGVEALLKHDASGSLFRRLQSKRMIVPEISLDDWIARLLRNYQTKYKTDEAVHSVKFNIKNNLLWKNGEIDFTDSIYHEVFIPYDDPLESQKTVGPADGSIIFRSLDPEGIHAGVTIRVFLVNGIIKLQIGKFSKSVSPDVTKKGLDIYKTFETITSFPLLYFSYLHKIPENYLNLSAYATDSWQRHQKGEKADMTKDWKEVVKDVADYNYVCSVADEYVEDRGRWEKTIKAFEAKRTPWLEREGFTDPFARNHGDDSFLDIPNNTVYFGNRYMNVYAVNSEDFKKHRQRKLYVDYYEERP